ncbi:hypothetical protein TNIN_217271 [Trichonephila inaurata madagascariensis]|uniref:Uncharacterized protein n=1 Tax=Trichonephila inaurata madagascariensis TaxID=2747483 RepID=A0A8X6XDS8_9ARAC|nr:hypothetical protein TNIN_217271 [Trichonephila inaurata madagascariensis]
MNSSSNHQIQDAAGHHIPRGGKRRNDCIPFWRDNNIEELIHERDQLGKELQNNNCEHLRCKLIEASHRVEEVISASKQGNGVSFAANLTREKEYPSIGT